MVILFTYAQLLLSLKITGFTGFFYQIRFCYVAYMYSVEFVYSKKVLVLDIYAVDPCNFAWPNVEVCGCIQQMQNINIFLSSKGCDCD